MTDASITSDSNVRIQGKSINFSIDKTPILHDVSMHARPGELIGLIGPNGAGKSTLLSLLAGLSSPLSGSVIVDQKRLSEFAPLARAQTIGWLEQIGHIHWPLSVRRLVSLGRYPHLSPWQKISEEDQQAIEAALKKTDSLHLQDRDATTLSGGERARVLMARVLAAQPTLLLADEPVSSLDLGHQLQTMDMLREFAQGNEACVVVLHDLSLAARYCDRLYLLNEGKVIAEGTPEVVLSNKNIRDVYGVDVISGRDSIPWIVPHQLVKPND